MFTGLVETTAIIRSLQRRGPEAHMRFEVALDRVELGESIACSGVCLTVTQVHSDGFDADVSAETLAVTTLGHKRVGSQVNIERSCRLGDRMGGHVVMGHVDGVGKDGPSLFGFVVVLGKVLNRLCLKSCLFFP